MNTPSLNDRNWRWRFEEQQLNGDYARKLALLSEISDRLPKPFSYNSDGKPFA